MSNICLLTDSYKLSHHAQYPPTTRHIYSFFEARTGEGIPTVTFFGLQYILKMHLGGRRVTPSAIAHAKQITEAHLGRKDVFNEAGWQHILDAHGGRLPVKIRAVPEGTTVPRGNVLMTVENTDPEVPWLTNHLETLLSQVWYPSTVCTQSREMKRDILNALRETGTPELIDFKLHDFGFRGSTSVESAGIGGLAHLVNFLGTDTMEAIHVGAEYYDELMAGFSIPAAEHSTITSWGKDRELDAYRNMLQQYPDGLVAVVSDSYDIFHACKELWGHSLRAEVLGRNGVLVVRPDSGHPPTIVCKVLSLLGSAFNYRINEKGFKVLDEHVRVIQGDGIDRAMVPAILDAMKAEGWSADNIAFGSGGGLLQKVNRDTLRFAFKCSAAFMGGQWKDVIKTPVTDITKTSKAGRLALIVDPVEGYKTIRMWDEHQGHAPHPDDVLETVYENGEIIRHQTLADVRARAAVGL